MDPLTLWFRNWGWAPLGVAEQFWNCQRSLNSCLVVASAELVSTAPGWSNVNCISLLSPSHSVLSCLSIITCPPPQLALLTLLLSKEESILYHSLSLSFPLPLRFDYFFLTSPTFHVYPRLLPLFLSSFSMAVSPKPKSIGSFFPSIKHCSWLASMLLMERAAWMPHIIRLEVYSLSLGGRQYTELVKNTGSEIRLELGLHLSSYML